MKSKIFIILILFCSFSVTFSQWQQIGPHGGRPYASAIQGSDLYIGVYGIGIYHSGDNGLTWFLISKQITNAISLAISGTTLFAGTVNGIYVSTNLGQSWTQTLSGVNIVHKIFVRGSLIFACTSTSGLYYSTDNGMVWNTSSFGGVNLVSFGADDINVYTGTDSSLYISSNNGGNWSRAPLPIGSISNILPINNKLFITANYGVYYSDDHGQSWVQTGFQAWTLSIGYGNTGIFVGTKGLGIFRSTDEGTTWNQTSFYSEDVPSIFVIGNAIIACQYNAQSGGCVFRSTDNGLSWMQPQILNAQVYSFTGAGSMLFAGGYNSGVCLSADNGVSWTQSSLYFDVIHAMTTNKAAVLAASRYGIYRSTDLGQNWATMGTIGYVSTMIFAGTGFFAGTWTGVYKSDANGSNWQPTSLGNGYIINALAANGTTIFAGTQNSGIFSSSNNGINWTPLSLNSVSVFSLLASGTNVFAGTGDGVFRSTDNGQTWNQGLSGETVNALAISGQILFAGTDNGVFVSMDNGATWAQRNEGMGNLIVNTLYVSNNYLFAGTELHSSFRRPVPELVGIEPIGNIVPKTYSIYQNYPNPFNPSTKIKFDIPATGKQTGNVELRVFDVTGRVVATLVDQRLEPGTYEVELNALNFTSGVYFYRITAGAFVESKKMILVK